MKETCGTRLARALAVCGLATSLAACTEPMPTAESQPDAVVTEPANRGTALPCTASTVARTVSCQVPLPSTDAAARVIGGQNVMVTLTSSSVSYDPGTGIFQFDVTVQNLLNEAIGLTGSVTLDPLGQHPDAADPEGIQVFFERAPTAVTGSGTITVINADGTGNFTASGQPFFAYHEILMQGEVSAPKTWQFIVPPTVLTFDFGMYLETDVEYLLVINEMLANPGGSIFDASGEWVEVYNAGSLAVDMQGLVIADSAASGRRPYFLVSAPLVVEPGLSVVLGNTTNTTSNGGVPVDYAYGSAMALANSLDAIKIARVVGSDTVTIDRTQFASAAISAQNGISRELKNPLLDNSNMDGSNWADALVTAVYGTGGRGTPGAQNSSFTPGMIRTEKPLPAPLGTAPTRRSPPLRR